MAVWHSTRVGTDFRKTYNDDEPRLGALSLVGSDKLCQSLAQMRTIGIDTVLDEELAGLLLESPAERIRVETKSVVTRGMRKGIRLQNRAQADEKK